MVCELHESGVRARNGIQLVPRDALEAPSRRGGGGGVRKGRWRGPGTPPPRPGGLQHVALVARRLLVPAGTKEECRGAWPPRYLPRRRLHSLQGWGVCPKKRSGGGVGWGPRAPCHCQGGLLHPQLPLPSAREGGGVPVWPPGSLGPRQRKGLPQFHRDWGQGDLHKVPSGVLPERREARVPFALGLTSLLPPV